MSRVDWYALGQRFVNALLTNDFVFVSAAMGLLGLTSTTLWKLGRLLYARILGRMCVSIEVQDPNDTHRWLLTWLAMQHQKPRSLKTGVNLWDWLMLQSLAVGRHVKAVTQSFLQASGQYLRFTEDADAKKVSIGSAIHYLPAAGLSAFEFRGHLVWCVRVESDNYGGNCFVPARVTIFGYGYSIDVLKAILAEAKEQATFCPPGEIVTFTNGGVNGQTFWTRGPGLMRRAVSSLFLANGLYATLRNDMSKFLERRDWYLRKGLPYRRGYLIHGPPGNGKTTTVLVLAADLNLTIACLSPSSCMTDAALASLLSGVPERCIALDGGCGLPLFAGTGDGDKDGAHQRRPGRVIIDGARPTRDHAVGLVERNRRYSSQRGSHPDHDYESRRSSAAKPYSSWPSGHASKARQRIGPTDRSDIPPLLPGRARLRRVGPALHGGHEGTRSEHGCRSGAFPAQQERRRGSGDMRKDRRARG